MKPLQAYILVFSSAAAWLHDDAKLVAEALDIGDKFYALDGNICFLRTAQSIQQVTERLNAGRLGAGKFFLAEIADSPRAGNMPPTFWNLLASTEPMSSVA